MVKWKYNYKGEIPPLPSLSDVLKIKEEARNRARKKGYNITIDEIDYSYNINTETKSIENNFDYKSQGITPQGWAAIIPVILAIAGAVQAYFEWRKTHDENFRNETYNHRIEYPDINIPGEKNHFFIIVLIFALLLLMKLIK